MGNKFKFKPEAVDIEVSEPVVDRLGSESEMAHDENNDLNGKIDKQSLKNMRQAGRFDALKTLIHASNQADNQALNQQKMNELTSAQDAEGDYNDNVKKAKLEALKNPQFLRGR